MTRYEAEPAWVRGAQAGSADAFGRLVQMHQQGLRAFLRRLSGNPADADDLAQETFVFAWEHIGRFDPARTFRPWLFGIGWRKYRERKRSWLRLLTREGKAAAMETSYAPDPGLKMDLLKAAESLPPEQRAAVFLCLGAEFPCRSGRGLGLAAGHGKIACRAGPGKTGCRAGRFEWMNRY